ncbi:MAG: hypothetical protein FWE88_08325 [Phycisphaerae bacterium]|nr:hypothetical protein [Phycisphaerae bacterium]
MNGKTRQTMVESTSAGGGELTKSYATGGETFFDITWRGAAAGVTAVTGLSLYYADSHETNTAWFTMDLDLPSLVALRTAVKASAPVSGGIDVDDIAGGSLHVDFSGTATSSLTLLGPDPVTTPLGAFAAAKVQFDITIIGSLTSGGSSAGTLTMTLTNTLWIVPGLGIVKMSGAVSASNAGKETYTMEQVA